MQKKQKSTITRTEIIDPGRVQFDPAHPAEKIHLDMDFKRLKKSIEQYGQLSDILVREEDGNVIVVVGKRRLLAIQQLGLRGVRCSFVEGDVRLLSFVENSLREIWTPMRLADEMHQIKQDKQVSSEFFSEILGKSMVEISEMLLATKFSSYVKDMLWHDERISFDSLRYILKKYSDTVSRNSAVSRFITALNSYVPSPSIRSMKQLQYVRERRKIFEQLQDVANDILKIIDDDSVIKEERAKICRRYILKLNRHLRDARERRKTLPAVSIYERKPT